MHDYCVSNVDNGSDDDKCKARAKRTGKKSQVDASSTCVETCVGWQNELASSVSQVHASRIKKTF